MSEILSQSEIDALLTALTTGEINAEEIKKEEVKSKVKVYDFRRPKKFSKEQLRSLTMIHENFARLFSNYLSAHLRSIVQVGVISVEQLSYAEFTSAVPTPTNLVIFAMPPLKGTAVLEINPSIAFALVDRLLGGPGNTIDKPRELTEIEQSIINRIIRKFLEFLTESWKSLVDIVPQVEGSETNSQFVQIVSPNETVALITFSIQLGNANGMANLCIPFLAFEPILDKLSARLWFAESHTGGRPVQLEELRYRVGKARVPVVVGLGETTISIREFLGLKVGDCLQLETRVDGDLPVYVGNRLKFYGRPGLVNNKLSIQITQVTQEGDEEND